MAGGRRTKRGAKAKATSKKTQKTDKELNAQRKENTSIRSSKAKNGSEKEECLLEYAKQNGSLSPLPSKYVPRFSRAGKNSCKSEEKSLTRSPNTRKRRSEVSLLDGTKIIAEVCKEKETYKDGRLSLSKFVEEGDIDQTVQNSTKVCNEDAAAHPSKQIKLSNVDRTNDKTTVTGEESATACNYGKMITKDIFWQSNANEKVVLQLFEEEKSTEFISQGCENPRPLEETPKNNKDQTSVTMTTMFITSSDTSIASIASIKKSYSANNNDISEEGSLIDDVKYCLTHLIEKVERDLKDAETVEDINHKFTQEQNSRDLSSSNYELTTTLENVSIKDITKKSSQTKVPKVNETEKQDIQPNKSNPVNESEVIHGQNTDAIQKQTSNVSNMDDLEFLMDCTDSQLIGDEVLEQSYTCTADENFRADTDSKKEVPDKTSIAKTSDCKLEDGTFLVQEIIRELSSVKSYLAAMKSKHEQMHKRSGPCVMPQ